MAICSSSLASTKRKHGLSQFWISIFPFFKLRQGASIRANVGWSVGLSIKKSKIKFFDYFGLFDELRSCPYMLSRQMGIKTDKDNIV